MPNMETLQQVEQQKAIAEAIKQSQQGAPRPSGLELLKTNAGNAGASSGQKNS